MSLEGATCTRVTPEEEKAFSGLFQPFNLSHQSTKRLASARPERWHGGVCVCVCGVVTAVMTAREQSHQRTSACVQGLKDKPVSCENVVCLHNLNPLFASPGGCLAPSITMPVRTMQVDAENAFFPSIEMAPKYPRTTVMRWIMKTSVCCE